MILAGLGGAIVSFTLTMLGYDFITTLIAATAWGLLCGILNANQ